MRRALLALAAAALAAGCGSTVPPQLVAGTGQPVAGSESGLTAPTGTTGQPGATVPGESGVVPGTSTGSTVTASSGPGGSVTASRNPTGPGASGARITSPLKIGVTYVNNQQASSMLGANDPRTNSSKTIVEAYVRAINKVGGLAGRKIETVEYEWHSGDGSWSTAASSACAKFTQDNHVSVVLDEAFGTIGGFRYCLQRAGTFDITSQNVGDDVASANATLYAGVGGLTLDRAYGAVLDDEVRSGYLSKHNQLGIIVESCPENLRAYSRALFCR